MMFTVDIILICVHNDCSDVIFSIIIYLENIIDLNFNHTDI